LLLLLVLPHADASIYGHDIIGAMLILIFHAARRALAYAAVVRRLYAELPSLFRTLPSRPLSPLRHYAMPLADATACYQL